MSSEARLPDEIVRALAELPVSLRGEVERAWHEFNARAAFQFRKDRLRDAIRVWGASPFVAKICCHDPALLLELFENRDLDREYDDGELGKRIGADATQAGSEAELMASIRRHRRKEMLRIAWRDLTGIADLNQTMKDLSTLAEHCVEHALAWCHRDHCRRFGVPRDKEGVEQHLVIIAMGKLGGYELNFSSDIDLVYAFPKDGLTDGRSSIENSQFFIRSGQRLIKVLNETTADGFVFRVDMRLRPFGEAGPLAMSFAAMVDYYQHHGRDWERYAMIKARVIPAHNRAGKDLLKRLRPFVYRRYLDYGAFEALRRMKALINAEIRRRGLSDNIKLGPGGIREVEFIGQTFQLIRGGRDLDLQQRSIQNVLRLLGEKGQLPDYAVKKLLAAYDFLRRVENRLQMIADLQTHILPTDQVQRARVAFAMGFSDWSSFEQALNNHRANVRDQFEQVFATPQFDESSESEHEATAASLKNLWHGVLDEPHAVQVLEHLGYQRPADAYNGITRHREGRFYRLNRAVARERMDRVMPLLIAAAGRSEDPDAVLPRLLTLIEAIAQRSVYLALLAEYPMALSQLVKLSAASPWIAQHLSRYPILLDELLDPRHLYSPPEKDGLQKEIANNLSQIARDDMELLMDRLRQFKQASVLRVAAADVMGALPLMKVSDRLTWLAEVVLSAALSICMHQLIGRYGRPRCVIQGKPYRPGFVIIAYGKLGGIELGYGSDLDIVFLHDSRGERQYTDGNKPVDNAVFFSRLGRRVIHMLTTFTPAGVLYEVDSRLRPSGASGLLVSSLQAYEDYQREEAWTWEHQALVRARMVAGDLRIGERFDRMRRGILVLPRDPDSVRREVRQMRERMWGDLSKTSDKWFDLKRDPGGIADIEFMVQYCVLANAHKFPSLSVYTDNIRILESLASCGLLASQDAQALMDIYREYRDRVHELSLQGEPSVVGAVEFDQSRARVRGLWQALMEH